MGKTQPSAKVLLDSLHPNNITRLTTMELTFHRFVLAEWNTYRNEVARNSASSRAIPHLKMLTRVREDAAYPVSFPREQKGMSGGEEVPEHLHPEVEWRGAGFAACAYADHLARLGVHKSVSNRLLEPFLWHTAIFTGTDLFWEHAFRQRCSPRAQPEIRASAEAARAAYQSSTPLEIPAEVGWHLPLVSGYDLPEILHEFGSQDPGATLEEAIESAKMISAARVARVSYLTHDGVRDWSADLDLFRRLRYPDPDNPEEPQHASPWEQVCTPLPLEDTCVVNLRGVEVIKNEPWIEGPFTGWRCFRHEVEDSPLQKG